MERKASRGSHCGGMGFFEKYFGSNFILMFVFYSKST